MTAPRLTVPDERYRRLLHGVKFIDGEFYLRCGSCHRAHRAAYWPMTLEFWKPSEGLTRCRACWATYRRLQQQRRPRNDPRHRRYYREAREVINFKKRAAYADKKAAA